LRVACNKVLDDLADGRARCFNFLLPVDLRPENWRYADLRHESVA
jgi:hypothetical protein